MKLGLPFCHNEGRMSRSLKNDTRIELKDPQDKSLKGKTVVIPAMDENNITEIRTIIVNEIKAQKEEEDRLWDLFNNNKS